MNQESATDFSSAPGGPQEERSSVFVLICGLGTTLLALAGVYFLDRNTTDFEIMGWYANYVIPVGAFLVGLASSSGYGFASWHSGVKITRNLLWTILALQVFAYFAAQYLEFLDIKRAFPEGTSVGFFQYYDFVARHFSWKQNDGSMGQPLGMWGYFFRGLEILGFVGGSLIAPLVLRTQPYCPACQMYMKTRQLTLIPASVPARRIKKGDEAAQAAYAQEQAQALESGQKTETSLQQEAAASHTAEFQKKLTDLQAGRKAANKLPIRFGLSLVHCKRCHAGQYVAKAITGQGKHIKQTEFARIGLHPEFVRAIIS